MFQQDILPDLLLTIITVANWFKVTQTDFGLINIGSKEAYFQSFYLVHPVHDFVPDLYRNLFQTLYQILYDTICQPKLHSEKTGAKRFYQ